MKDVDLNYWPAHSSTAVLKEHEAGDGWSPCFLNFLIRHTSSWSNVWGFNELLFLSLLSLSFFFPLSLPLCQLQIGEQPASWGNQLFEQCVYNLVMLPIKTANLSWDCNSLVFLNQKKKEKMKGREKMSCAILINVTPEKVNSWNETILLTISAANGGRNPLLVICKLTAQEWEIRRDPMDI